jgi:hypothetical protein
MAKKHLSEDEIRYIVSVESNEAQNEVRKLGNETRKLAKEERARREAMIELEAQGKKNSKAYDNLKKESEGYSAKIKENNKRVQELTSKLDVNALSMVQLRKRAKELQSQLDNTAEALNPESYAKTAAELDRVKNRMGELRNGGQKVRNEFDLTQSAMSKLKVAAMALITVKLGEWLGAALSKAYSTRKEFAKYEAVLRNTIGSQDAAADSMKRLQQLAADTPYSLQEWTEGYIKLINRGIKPTNEQLIQMGDIAASQGKTLDQFIEALLDAMTGENERLKEFGIRANAAGDKVKFTFKGVTTEVEKSDSAIVNYVLSLGKLQGVAGGMAVQMNELAGQESNLGDTMDAFWNRLGKRLEPFFKNMLGKMNSFVKDLTKSFTPLNETFEEHLAKVVTLDQKLPSMISKYNELKSKTNLTKTEQEELNKVLSEVSDIVPGAITQWDKYGNALSMNTKKVYEYLTAEKYRLRYEHRELINQAAEDMAAAETRIKGYTELINGGGINKIDPITEDVLFVKFTDEELKNLKKNITSAGESYREAKATYEKYAGTDIEKIINERLATEKYASAVRASFVKMNAKQLEQWIADEKNASNRYMSIAEEIYASKQKANGTTTSPSDKSDPNAIALKNLETANEDKLNAIRLAGREQQQSEYETEQAVLKQEEDYYLKRISMLQKFAETAKKKDKRAAYESQIVTAKTKLLDIEVSKEQQAVKALESLRDAELSDKDKKYNEDLKAYRVLLDNKKISEQQYDIYVAALDKNHADSRLSTEKDFDTRILELIKTHGNVKENTVKDINSRIESAEKKSYDARINAEKTYKENVATLQKMASDSNKDSGASLDAEYELRRQFLDATYLASVDYAQKAGQSTLDIESNYEKAKLVLHKQYIDEKVRLSEESTKKIMAFGDDELAHSIANTFNAGAELQKIFENISSPTFWDDFGEDIIKNVAKLVTSVTGGLSSAFNTFKNIEIDNVEAKYNAEIEAAKGNTEEVERLEQEKAQKKLDIEKKYADVNFAVKASEIVANTALAIMMALAELGPIAGPIAAGLMAATGAVQLAAANAERQKVKSMTLSSSSSSSSSGKRVATGRESGGYVDVTREQDGKPFRAKYDPSQRGYVDKPTVIVGEGPSGQSREWVASNAAVSNPSVAPIIDVIDKAQRAGNIRTLDLNAALKARGYVGGGYIATPTVTPTPTNNNDNSGAALPPELMRRLAQAVINIDENGVAAPVVLTELEKKQQLRDRSRKIGSKKG